MGGLSGTSVHGQKERRDRDGFETPLTYLTTMLMHFPHCLRGSDVSVSEGELDECAGVVRHGEAWRGVGGGVGDPQKGR